MLRVAKFVGLTRRRIHTTVSNQNHYRTLKLKRGATTDEIKKAHKALAREYHPDRPGGDKEKFILVQEAFECLKNEENRAAYDIEIFGKVREQLEEHQSQFYPGAPGVWVRPPGEQHVSQKYHEAVNEFEKIEKSFNQRFGKIKDVGTKAKEKPVHALVICLLVGTGVYLFDRCIRKYLAWLCSDYKYSPAARMVELPNTPGYENKMKYIEEMLSEVPEDIVEQYDLYGFKRDWLIEFYYNSTRAGMRNETPTLHQALRYLPFVGLAFLKGEIPENPAADFKTDSAKCLVCEFIFGKITRVYPAEYLEQHANRAHYFLKIFLQKKNEDAIAAPFKEENPDFIHHVTGKPNVSGRQYRQIDEAIHGAPYGIDIKNMKDVYGDAGYEKYRRRYDTKQY